MQTAFTALDAGTLARDARRGVLPALRQVRRRSLAALAGIWIGYFIIQTTLMSAAPRVDELVTWLAVTLVPSVPPADAASWALGPLLVATWLVAGFWDYVLHRGLLHGRWGWFLHESHHLPTVVGNGIPGISVRPYVAVTTFLTSLGTAAVMLAVMAATDTLGLLDAYLRSLPFLIVALTLVGSASHSAFLRQFPAVHGALRPLGVTTPQEHILHHGALLHGNYGNFTILWDRVFGTYLNPADHDPRALRLGLTYDQDFLGAVTAGRVQLPDRVRDAWALGAFCHLGDGRDRTARRSMVARSLNRRGGAAREEPLR